MIKNLRRPYWIVSSFIKKYGPRIIASAIVTIIIFVAIPQLLNKIPTGKPHHRIGRVGQHTINQLPTDIQKLVTQGLTDITESGTATPSLALNWKIEEGGLEYTFFLDQNKQWQNDKPVQAADISYSFDDIEQLNQGPFSIKFKLKEPFAPLPVVLNAPIFKQEKRIKKLLRGDRYSLIGSGQYKVTKIKNRGQYIDSLKLESPKLNQTFKFYTTETAALLGFKLGEIDILQNLADPNPLTTWKNVQIQKQVNFNRYLAVFFNTDDPLLSDKNIRQALTYAITPKPEDDSRALSPINPHSWAYNPQVKPYNSNTQRAKQLIKDSLPDDQQEITIRLDTTLAYLDFAEKIKQSWSDLGINTEIKVINSINPDYQALLAVHQIPPDPDQYTLWHSTQPTNLTHLKSPKIDKLLEDGRKTLDPNKRKDIYIDFQRFLLEECPAAFISHQITYTISRK